MLNPLRIEYPVQDQPQEIPMADNRTMAQLLEAPTEGYEDAIVVPEITANNFEIKHGLLNLVQNKQFFDTIRKNPTSHNPACPHHGFSELHQLDTFYNALNTNDQDSLNSAAGGSHCQSRYELCTPAVSSDVAELKDLVRALLLDKKNQAPAPAPAPVKAIEPSCVTCGGAHSYQQCPATGGNMFHDNIQAYVSQPPG
ncbi:hypothetical protein Tco_0429354 [Tanacetum coccineum]